MEEFSDKKLKFLGFFLIAASLFPILPPAAQSILIVGFCLISIILYRKNFLKRIENRKVIVSFLFFISYYLWYLLSALWSNGVVEALVDAQSSLILLFFPVIFLFFLPKISQDTLRYILLLFVFVMAGYLVLWWQSYITGVSYYQVLDLKELPVKEYEFIDKISYFFNKGYYWISGTSIRGYRLADEEMKLFVHHNYIASYVTIGFYSALKSIHSTKKLLLKFALLLIAIVFLLFVFYVPSIMNQLALLITLPVFLYSFYGKKIAIAIILIGFIGVGQLIFKNYDKIQTIKLVETDNLISTETSIIDFYRYHIYKCISYKIPDNFFLGMGKGDVQPYLNSCLPDDEWPGLSETKLKYNTHSQPLDYFISGGIIGLFLFIALLIRLFSLAFSQNRFLLIILIVIFANLLFENYLTRVWGAFSFMFFTLVLLQTDFTYNSHYQYKSNQ